MSDPSHCFVTLFSATKSLTFIDPRVSMKSQDKTTWNVKNKNAKDGQTVERQTSNANDAIDLVYVCVFDGEVVGSWSSLSCDGWPSCSDRTLHNLHVLEGDSVCFDERVGAFALNEKRGKPLPLFAAYRWQA